MEKWIWKLTTKGRSKQKVSRNSGSSKRTMRQLSQNSKSSWMIILRARILRSSDKSIRRSTRRSRVPMTVRRSWLRSARSWSPKSSRRRLTTGLLSEWPTMRSTKSPSWSKRSARVTRMFKMPVRTRRSNVRKLARSRSRSTTSRVSNNNTPS